MVNPGDLIPEGSGGKRATLQGHEAGSLKEEAMEGSIVKKRLFRHDIYKRKIQEVYLPILIIPGVASSGLHVEESSLDEKYEGLRLWMNPTFLAKGRLQNKILNADEIERARTESKASGGLSSWLGGVRGDGGDDDGGSSSSTASAFGMAEDEFAVKNAWIHHIALDKNMIDEKPGNKVRPYGGVSTV